MDKYRVLDLFSGIGGFSLGLELTGGFETVAFCEIEKYPQKVLAKHWPDVPLYEDVRDVTRERLAADGIFPNVITGGFPCQDISAAGNQAGIGEGTRSGLWSECARLLGEIRPDYAIFENVTALISGNGGRWFQRVLFDISALGYDVEWHCIPASSLGAPHQRDRVWIIAFPQHPNTNSLGPHREKIHEHRGTEPTNEQVSIARSMGKILADPERQRQPGPRMFIDSSNISPNREGKTGDVKYVRIGGEWSPEPSVGRVANGIPDRSHRLKGLGNAVVPQIPELIGRAILNSIGDNND